MAAVAFARLPSLCNCMCQTTALHLQGTSLPAPRLLATSNIAMCPHECQRSSLAHTGRPAKAAHLWSQQMELQHPMWEEPVDA